MRGAVVVLALAASAAGGASPRTNGLGAAGWSTAPPAPGEADIPCTLERLATLGGATFLSQYAGKKPFILSAGGVDGTLARHAASWARQEFLERFGAAEVAVGKPISREAVRTNRDVPLRDYADGLLAPQIANEPDPTPGSCREEEEGAVYLFDRGQFFESHPEVAWQPPAFLRETDSGSEFGKGAAWKGVFALGGQSTGIPFHLHGDAWLELLAGAKRWAIYSMADVGTPPGGFAESRPHSAWLRDVYPELVAGTLKGPLPHECVQLLMRSTSWGGRVCAARLVPRGVEFA